MRIVRVFPRLTKATPTDELAFVGNPPMGLEADEVHVSCTFTYDLPEAERLEKAWRVVGTTRLGGPALGEPGGDFVPGRYLKSGYTITSRGCPNRCWFCSVWKREDGLRELPIRDGWIVQDDNLLACSENHVRDVFAMLKRQPHKAELRGLEAKALKDWHIDLLVDLKPASAWFAYDTPDDYEPLLVAGKRLAEAGLSPERPLKAYVLIGYPEDSLAAAQKRLNDCYTAGFWPFAMLWRDQSGRVNPEWKVLQRQWTRPAITRAILAGKTSAPQAKALL